MKNLSDKVKRYLEKCTTEDKLSLKEGLINIYDSFLDGNLEFLLSSASEYKSENSDVMSIEGNTSISNSYDDFTIKSIYRFVSEFQKEFPGILTDQEILRRIKRNLKSSIIFDDLSDEVQPNNVGNRVYGYYNPRVHKIYLDNCLTSADIDSILFHEFIHCITIYDDEKNKDLESEFITETITSIMQEKVMHNKYKNYDRRSNNYITNYAKMLETIFGKTLYKEFILNFRDITKLFREFPNSEYNEKHVLRKFNNLFNYINEGVHKGDRNIVTNLFNTIFELNMTMFLANYLSIHKELTEKEKLDKINRMLFLQKTPNFDLFRIIIDKNIKNKDCLYLYPNLRFVMNPNRILAEKNYLLKDKYTRFLASKRVTSLNIIDYKNNPLFGKDNVFYTYNRNYINYIRLQDYYNIISKLYYDCDINLYGSKIEEVVCDKYADSKELVRELLTGSDVSSSSLMRYKKKFSDNRRFVFKAIKNNNSLYIENDIIPNIYIKRNVMDLISRVKGSGLLPLSAKLVMLSQDNIEEVYLSRRGNNIIYEKDGETKILRYNNVKLKYDEYSFKNKPVYLVNSFIDNSKVKSR